MKKILAFILLSFGLLAAVNVIEYKLSIESDKYAGVDEDALFKQYCGSVERISVEIPKPNYDDPLVMGAVANLNTVAPVSFYMYSAVIKNYGFKKETDKDFPWDTYGDILKDPSNQAFGMKKDWSTGDSTFDAETLKNKFDYEYVSMNPENVAPEGVKGNSHAFLTYLCGEFRDRPTLIKEKLEWVTNMIKLPAKVQEKINAVDLKDGESVWQKITAESYAYYVTFSRKAFKAKENMAWGEDHSTRLMKLSDKWQVDRPVPAFTVCEVKYMFTEYVTQPTEEAKQFPGYEVYTEGFKNYQASYCKADDNDYYYDFRGDSNMKPNSPESNGMIWHATSILGRCKRDAQSRVSVKQVKGEDGTWKELDFPKSECIAYMSKPFSSRWNAARAALAVWTLRNEKFDPDFQYTGNLVTIIPSLIPEMKPASFRFYDSVIHDGSDTANFMDGYAMNVMGSWLAGDIGFTEIFGIKSDSEGGVSEIDYAYERIKDSVDRHTDWYASGYDDSNFEPQRARKIDQAYSPFVASSYEMSESDAFTAPGITVNGPKDGRRQWMFVFKVHKDKWYNTNSLIEGKAINFETQWFDETSFGTTSLADSERAWDRLGTPLEGEMESILYLHNITNTGRAIKDMGSSSQYPPVVDDNLGATQ